MLALFVPAGGDQPRKRSASDHLARAMRLSPLDPIMRSFRNATAHAYFCDGRLSQAVV